MPLAPGNCVFLFSARARDLSKCPGPRTGQNPTKSPFPTGGGPTEKKVVPEKVAESVVTLFFDFGTPVALGPEKGPAELLAAC